MKKLFPAVVSLLLISFAHAQPVQVLTPRVPASPASFSSVIKDGSRCVHGYFTVYESDDHYYFEIPDSILGRDILVVNRIVRAPQESGNNDDRVGVDEILSFRKNAVSGQMDIVLRSYEDRALDSASETFGAMTNSGQPVIIGSLPIQAASAGKTGSLLDFTELIRNGGLLTNNAAESIGAISIASDVVNIKAMRRMGPTMNSHVVKPVEVNSSLYLLPAVPMRPRYFDERVGFLKTTYKDYTEDPEHIKTMGLIHRWRLEPRPEDSLAYAAGQVVEPQHPILFYIDPATPRRWQPYFIRAVEDWQQAFEQAGFKNAIRATIADSSVNLQSARAAIIYKASDIAKAAGPVIVDPRSGEIIQAHIEFFHGMLRLLHNWYMIQAGASDSGARRMTFDDELMGLLIQRVITHEIGHTLGLEHNWGSSSTVPVHLLRDKGWLELHGHTPSIMDYARFNFVAQPQDHISRNGLLLRIGDYDRWAIQWGYRLYPGQVTPETENAWLRSRVTEKLKDPRLWWGNGELYTSDPRSLAEDLGDDDAVADEYGMQNLQRVMQHLVEWTTRPGEGYDDLTELYNSQTGLLNQYRLYIGHVAAIPGGRYRTARVAPDTLPVFRPVPAARQREAVAFLSRRLFSTPAWLVDPAVTGRTGDDPMALIGEIQQHALFLLLGRLDSLAIDETCEAHETFGTPRFAASVYTPADLLADLHTGIWAELAARRPIDGYRRNLQLAYLDQLKRWLDNEQRQERLSYVTGVIRAHLRDLRKEVNAALPAYAGTATHGHLEDVLTVIDSLLTHIPISMSVKN